MNDDPEKIANASLHQRAALMADIKRLRALLKQALSEMGDGHCVYGTTKALMQQALTGRETFEAGPDECDTGVALTKAIDAVLAEDDEIERQRALTGRDTPT